MTEDNHYRYCFFCKQWKTKQEINEIDVGPQPGGGNGKSYNCNLCRKDLGDQIQIFRCPNHNEEILKVWGTLEGENKEKIFFDKCPQENQEQKPTTPPSSWGRIGNCLLAILISAFVIGIITGFLTLILKEEK